MIGILFKPLAYLTIKMDSKGKIVLDIILPIIIAFIISLILLKLKMVYNVNIFDSKYTLVSNLAGFIQTLPGFFIAALAAIASFSGEDMNKIIRNPTLYIANPNRNPPFDKLSRRRFLSFLFAYLTYISIITYFAIVITVFLNSFSIGLSVLWINIGFFISCFLMIFLIMQIILLTFFGLWYLGERIHLNDAP